jgi:hypothetical protein
MVGIVLSLSVGERLFEKQAYATLLLGEFILPRIGLMWTPIVRQPEPFSKV